MLSNVPQKEWTQLPQQQRLQLKHQKQSQNLWKARDHYCLPVPQEVNFNLRQPPAGWRYQSGPLMGNSPQEEREDTIRNVKAILQRLPRAANAEA